jgi:DNA-directed RNA polymerase specialized sigma subunit
MAELRRRSRERQYATELAALEPLQQALAALPPEALDGLNERERTIVCLRYGLRGKKVHSQYEIADQLGIKQPLVSSVVRRITVQLLGWDALDPEGKHRVICAVCGATTHVQRTKPGVRYACSPACSSELRRARTRSSRQTRRLAELMPVRASLRALPDEIFEVLSERDRAIVRGYYGLAADDVFHTQDELAQQFGINQTSVGAILRKSAQRLL